MATLGEYLGSGANTTKLLLHLNNSSADSSGNGNNGTDTNITYSQANGKFGQGAGFNGSSSKIAITDTASLRPTRYTFLAWVKTTDLTNGLAIFSSVNSKASPTTVLGIIFRISAGKINIYSAPNNDANIGNYDSTSSIPSGVMTMVGATYDGSNIRFYINGNLDRTVAYTYDPVYYTDGTNHINVGSWKFDRLAETNFFNGSIDEVIIENRAWTPQQVAKYYANAKGRWATL